MFAERFHVQAGGKRRPVPQPKLGDHWSAVNVSQQHRESLQSQHAISSVVSGEQLSGWRREAQKAERAIMTVNDVCPVQILLTHGAGRLPICTAENIAFSAHDIYSTIIVYGMGLYSWATMMQARLLLPLPESHRDMPVGSRPRSNGANEMCNSSENSLTAHPDTVIFRPLQRGHWHWHWH